MELWIRSQDKEKLLKVNDIAIEMNMIYGYFDKNTEYEHLGSYATKERALEVLDGIQNIIKIKFALQCDKEIAFNGFPEKDIKFLLSQCAVFDMPQD